MGDGDYPIPISGIDGANDDGEATDPSATSPIHQAPDLERLATGFVHCLRSGGLTVPIRSSLQFTRALRAVGIGNGDDVYWAGRSTLVVRPEDIAMYLSLIHI